jgi:hypothetical protein
MARVFRSMARNGDTPVVAPSGEALGVRAAPHPCHVNPCRADVHPDGQGMISTECGAHPEQHKAPRAEGMSVAPGWRDLPYFKIPSRLQRLGLVKKARGGDHLFCWKTGSGPFEAADAGEGLRLYPDKPTHGVLAPAVPMHVDEYQRCLAATRSAWKIIEEDPSR